MTTDQIILFSLLVVLFAFLIWGRFRYDLVAFGALVLALITGVVKKDQAFSGFGHPATVIIALVLIVSRGLWLSGAIDVISRPVLGVAKGLKTHIGLMAGLSAVLSSFMNNVAALALLMPVDLQAARKAKRSPALTLMPLSFASILGGMITLIGTPPNIVIATFRGEALGEPYGMLDFAPVGIIVAVIGVLYVAFIGWRLIPKSRSEHNTEDELKELKGYVAETKVPEGADIVGKPLRKLDPAANEHDVNVLGVVRNQWRLPGPTRHVVVEVGDIVILEGSPTAIEGFLGSTKLTSIATKEEEPSRPFSETSRLVEVVVPQGARIEGRSTLSLELAATQDVMLLGVSRKGKRFRDRIRRLKIQAGDLLLLVGPEERISEVVRWLGCLPLAKRGLDVTQPKKAWIAVGIFMAAILVASFGLLYLPIALAAAALIFVLMKITPLSQVYESVEWPVIVLLGSLIPIGAAFDSCGGTELIARTIVSMTEGLPAYAVLVIIMAVTMTLSDVLNNVATALIAAPIGIEVAASLNVNPDPFLMAVAVASSCAFLTPIGHKNNTIIMGPGGYRFGDYWRMGLPLEVLVLAVGAPAIMLFWPL